MSDLKEKIVSFRRGYEETLKTVQAQLQGARQQMSQIQAFIKQKEGEELIAYNQVKALNDLLLTQDTPPIEPQANVNAGTLKANLKTIKINPPAVEDVEVVEAEEVVSDKS